MFLQYIYSSSPHCSTTIPAKKFLSPAQISIMSDNIPVEVQMNIVRRLPVKQLLQCRTVSKSWKAHIDTLHFTASYGVKVPNVPSLVLCYRQRYKGYMCFLDQNLSRTNVPTNLSYSDMIPVGYSHGVLGFSHGPIVSDFLAVVWNPSIRRSVTAYVPYATQSQEFEKRLLAFGVRPDNLDPIFLKISYPFNPEEHEWSVLLFSFSSREWNTLETQFLPRQSIRLKKASQCVVGGHIFWCGYEKFYSNDGSIYKNYMMVSFDLVTHRFQELYIPDELLVNLPKPFFLSNLRDNIVLSGNIIYDDFYVFVIWLITIAGGSIASFQCLLNIPTPCKFKLIGFNANNDPILEVQNPEGFATTLGIHNIASGTFVSLGIEGDGGSFYIAPYCESAILQTHVDRTDYGLHNLLLYGHV